MRLSRLSSIALSALLAIGHSLCACPDMNLPRAHSEPTAHACCPPDAGESESADGNTDHSGKPCPHCSTALQGTIETQRAVAFAPIERSLVPATLVAAPMVPSHTVTVVRAYAQPPELLIPPSPEQLHISLLI